jgi:hypothetical protein
MIRAYFRIMGQTRAVEFDTDCFVYARFLAIEYAWDSYLQIKSSILLVRI